MQFRCMLELLENTNPLVGKGNWLVKYDQSFGGVRSTKSRIETDPELLKWLLKCGPKAP